MQSVYEAMPHGEDGFRMAVYSEKTYGAPLHYHDEYGIFYLAEGKMKFGIAGDDYEISAGDIIFIEPGTPYYALRTDEGDSFHYYAVLFHAELLGAKNDPCRRFFSDCRVNRFLVMSDEFPTLLLKMRQWFVDPFFGSEILSKTALFNIIAHIVNTGQFMRLSELSNMKIASETVDCVIKHIEAHYREHISIDDILKQISYSRSHLLRVFKEHTGMSIMDYLNKFRIEKACLELIYTDKSVTEIALDNGYNTVQYFTRMFRRVIGTPPGAYRRLSRSNTNVPHMTKT